MITNKLTEEYDNFIENLLFLVDQNHINFFKTSKIKKKNHSQILELIKTSPNQRSKFSNYKHEDFLDEFRQLASQIEFQDKSLWLPSNANFIYLMSLYENFLSKSIKLLITHHKGTKEKYMQKYQGDAESLNKEGDRSLIKDIRDTNKCIENIDLLSTPQYKKYINHLLGLQHKDTIYLTHNNLYIEARERRNLFVHRGTEIDSKFEKSLTENLASEGDKNNKSSKKLIAFSRIFSRELRPRWHGGKKDCNHDHDENKKNSCLKCSAKYKTPTGRDLSVNPGYFEHAASTLFFLSSVIYRTAFNIASNDKDEMPNLNKEHDFMCKIGLDFDRPLGYLIPLEINAYSEKYLAFKADDVANINYYLCSHKLIEKSGNLKNKKDKNSRILDWIEGRDHFFQNIDDENLKKILSSYVNNNHQDYLLFAMKVATRKKQMLDWFMTKDFLKSIQFKKLLANIDG